MPKYTASILLIAAVFCCSSLAYPFYVSDESAEKIALKSHRGQDVPKDFSFYNDELTLSRYRKNNPQNVSSKKHKREFVTDNEEVSEKVAEDSALQALIVDVLVKISNESDKEGLRQKLEDAVKNLHWYSIDEFYNYALKIFAKAALNSDRKIDESYFKFPEDSSNEA